MRDHAAVIPSRDKRIIRSRRALREALLQLLAEKPLEQISTLEIISLAKVGKATFYRHFSTKDQLLTDVAVDEIRDLLSFAAPLVAQVGNLESARALCSFIDDRRPLWAALLNGGAAYQIRAEYIRQSCELIPSRLREVGQVAIEASTIYSSAGTIELLAWWLRSAPHLSARDVAAMLSKLVLLPKLA